MGFASSIAFLGSGSARARVALARTALALLLVALAADGRAEALRVAAVFGTPVEEPWVGRIHSALLRASGSSGIHYRWSDDVAPDAIGPALRDYAQQGYDLIVADSYGAEAPARAVALDFPQTAFLLGSGGGPTAPNVAVFDNWIHEPAYLAGMIAGALTRSDRIGVVSAMPIPEVNRLANAFCHGAREVNPAVRCRTSFIEAFFDPDRARAAAAALIEDGSDVIYAERLGAIEAAAERGVACSATLPIKPIWPRLRSSPASSGTSPPPSSTRCGRSKPAAMRQRTWGGSR